MLMAHRSIANVARSAAGPTAHGMVIVGLVTAVLHLFPVPVIAAEIVLELRDGRMLAGEIDERTDHAELWLHSVEPSILVLTAVPWADVASARLGKATWSAEALRKSAEELKTPAPAQVLRQPALKSFRTLKPLSPLRVQSIDLVASLANWDQDAEPDGIELRVIPLTADGSALPVDGMVSVRLLGRRVVSHSRLESSSSLGFWSGGSAVLENRTAVNTQPYLEVGRWNERVRKSDLTKQGDYVLRLPFRNIHPEYDLDIAEYGQIEAKFNVTGQSVFRATAPVSLRMFSPFREELQLHRNTRFFPDELLGH